MNRWALVLSLVVAMLLGCAMGFIGSVMMARATFGEMPPMFAGGPFGHHGPGGPGGPGGPENHGARFERLVHALDLTPDQVARLKPRVEATRKQFDALRDSMHAQIDRELTPVQRVKFKKLQAMRPFPRPGHDRGAWPPPPPADSGDEKEPNR
jgi:Spy/CpxP family protein refolding chaperone